MPTATEVRERLTGPGGMSEITTEVVVELQHENLPRNASSKLLKNVLRSQGEVGFEETL